MRYLAGRHLNTGERQYDPGDEVPEAAEWTRLDAYVNGGEIVLLLEDGEHPPIGVNPSDCFVAHDDAMARAVGSRWLGASDAPKADPADTPSDDGADASDTASADAPDEDAAPVEEKPAPAKRARKATKKVAKKPTKRA